MIGRQTQEDFNNTIQLAMTLAEVRQNASSAEEILMNLIIAGKFETAEYLEEQFKKLKKEVQE